MRRLNLKFHDENDFIYVDTITFQIPESKQMQIRYNNLTMRNDRFGNTYHQLNNFRLLDSKFVVNKHKIFTGSISKYINGDNSLLITYTEFMDALERLSHLLGVDLFDVSVYRIDLAITANLKTNVNEILKNLHSPYRNLKLDEKYASTKYYHVKGKKKYITISFYDKGKEANQLRNALRYEVQFYKEMLKREFSSSRINGIIENMQYLEQLFANILFFFEVKESCNLFQYKLGNIELRLIDEAREKGFWNVMDRLSEYKKMKIISTKTESRHKDTLIEYTGLIRSTEFEQFKKETKMSYFRKLKNTCNYFLDRKITCGSELKYVPITKGRLKKGRTK